MGRKSLQSSSVAMGIKWKVMGVRGLSQIMEILCFLIEIVVTRMYMFLKTHRIVHLGSLRFIVCKFYLKTLIWTTIVSLHYIPFLHWPMNKCCFCHDTFSNSLCWNNSSPYCYTEPNKQTNKQTPQSQKLISPV